MNAYQGITNVIMGLTLLVSAPNITSDHWSVLPTVLSLLSAMWLTVNGWDMFWRMNRKERRK